MIATNGAITSGASTTEVTLPHRGMLRVCASTTVKLAADASVPAGEIPGLMMVIDHGAIEASFATGRNSDVLLTPDFRILIGGPGAADVKVRLGQHGDTCVDNAGVNAPYVLVTSVFDGSIYRVQPGQRVMFQHGSVFAVVDQEKEPCGCPRPCSPTAMNSHRRKAQASRRWLRPAPPGVAPAGAPAEATRHFVHKSGLSRPRDRHHHGDQPHASRPQCNVARKEAAENQKRQEAWLLTRIGHFFRRMFGAE